MSDAPYWADVSIFFFWSERVIREFALYEVCMYGMLVVVDWGVNGRAFARKGEDAGRWG